MAVGKYETWAVANGMRLRKPPSTIPRHSEQRVAGQGVDEGERDVWEVTVRDAGALYAESRVEPS